MNFLLLFGLTNSKCRPGQCWPGVLVQRQWCGVRGLRLWHPVRPLAAQWRHLEWERCLVLPLQSPEDQWTELWLHTKTRNFTCISPFFGLTKCLIATGPCSSGLECCSNVCSSSCSSSDTTTSGTGTTTTSSASTTTTPACTAQEGLLLSYLQGSRN